MFDVTFVLYDDVEDVQTHSVYDRATLHLADHPAESNIPRGWDLYGLLTGGA